MGDRVGGVNFDHRNICLAIVLVIEHAIFLPVYLSISRRYVQLMSHLIDVRLSVHLIRIGVFFFLSASLNSFDFFLLQTRLYIYLQSNSQL